MPVDDAKRFGHAEIAIYLEKHSKTKPVPKKDLIITL